MKVGAREAGVASVVVEGEGCVFIAICVLNEVCNKVITWWRVWRKAMELCEGCRRNE